MMIKVVVLIMTVSALLLNGCGNAHEQGFKDGYADKSVSFFYSLSKTYSNGFSEGYNKYLLEKRQREQPNPETPATVAQK